MIDYIPEMDDAVLNTKNIIVKLYPYEDAYENYTRKTEVEGHENGVEFIIQENLINNADYLNGTLVEMISALLTTITNAGVYALGGSLSKNFEINFTYPLVGDNVNDLKFNDLTIRFPEFGKFMVFFEVDGIESNCAGIIDVVEV